MADDRPGARIRSADGIVYYATAEEARAADIEGIFEIRRGAVWAPPDRPHVSIEQLAAEGLAHPDKKSRYRLTPEGAARLGESNR